MPIGEIGVGDGGMCVKSKLDWNSYPLRGSFPGLWFTGHSISNYRLGITSSLKGHGTTAPSSASVVDDVSMFESLCLTDVHPTPLIIGRRLGSSPASRRRPFHYRAGRQWRIGPEVYHFRHFSTFGGGRPDT